MSWADRLKAARNFCGLGQQEMAGKLDIPYRTYQNYESGITEPKGSVLEGLVALGFDGNWVLTGNGEMRRGASAFDPGADDDYGRDWKGDADLLMDCFIADTELMEESSMSFDNKQKKTFVMNMFEREKARVRALEEERQAPALAVRVENHS